MTLLNRQPDSSTGPRTVVTNPVSLFTWAPRMVLLHLALFFSYHAVSFIFIPSMISYFS